MLIRSRLCLLLISVLFTPKLWAGDILSAHQGARQFFSMIFENDVFFQEDGGYTNGLGFFYGKGPVESAEQLEAPKVIQPLMDWVGFTDRSSDVYAISYQFGQIMNTPEDIKKASLIEDQQPYSGIAVVRTNVYQINANKTKRLGLTFGVVGPLSLAEPSQKVIHSLTGGTDPQGWEHQLNNEVVFRLDYSHSTKRIQRPLGKSLAFEAVSVAHASLGTLSSALSAGIELKLGRTLSDVAHVAIEVPGREVNPLAYEAHFNWYLFVDLLGRYVLNDIAIDGNYFSKSHGVELIHEQTQMAYGVNLSYGHWALGYARAVPSRGYRGQPKSSQFGAINITYSF